MADPQTANLLLYQPTRGSDPGTWDSPVNANTGAVDSLASNVAIVALTNAPVTLTTPPNSGAAWAGPYQSQSGILRFTGALTSNVTVTLPRPGFWMVENLCTGAFVVTLASAAPGNVICAPPGEATYIYCDGVNVKYVDFGRVGSYIDLAVSAVPAWIAGCTIKPYLNCDGSVFSSATYPALATILGTTTLPDLRGRVRAALNQGTGRISASGVNGDVILSAGGADIEIIAKANLPNYNLNVTDPTHFHTLAQLTPQQGSGAPLAAATGGGGGTGSTGAAATGITVGLGGGGTALPTMPPVQVAGLTLIRAG